MTNVTSLLKTVKTVEDEAARGTQALESSIEAISQEMAVCTISGSTISTMSVTCLRSQLFSVLDVRCFQSGLHCLQYCRSCLTSN